MSANHAPALSDAVSDTPAPQGDSDYDIILTALMETPRGRAFLQEYAHRNRNADTATLLMAIGRIEGLLISKGLEPAASEPPAATESARGTATESNATARVEMTVVETVTAAESADASSTMRDPFADIRALSDIEKIALFT